MNLRILNFFSLILLAALFHSCLKDDDNLTPLTGNTVELSKIEAVLNGKNKALIELLNRVRGSVGKRGPASKTIWSRKNDYGLGLYISANHVIGIDSWQKRKAEYIDIKSVDIGIFETSQIPPTNGEIMLGNTLIADFLLFHSDIDANATNTTILPSDDFYFGIIDNQRVEKSLLGQTPELVNINTPLSMYDPYKRTIATKTWSNPVSGENVILVGYPQDISSYPNGAVLYGKILSDKEANQKIKELKTAGDSEGDIPYNSTVEFLVSGRAVPGMSGGGVFNNKGQLLGIMVRGSDTKDAPKIVRVIKVEYMKSKLESFYKGLNPADKRKLAPFISGEING